MTKAGSAQLQKADAPALELKGSRRVFLLHFPFHKYIHTTTFT